MVSVVFLSVSAAVPAEQQPVRRVKVCGLSPFDRKQTNTLNVCTSMHVTSFHCVGAFFVPVSLLHDTVFHKNVWSQEAIHFNLNRAIERHVEHDHS